MHIYHLKTTMNQSFVNAASDILTQMIATIKEEILYTKLYT